MTQHRLYLQRSLINIWLSSSFETSRRFLRVAFTLEKKKPFTFGKKTTSCRVWQRHMWIHTDLWTQDPKKTQWKGTRGMRHDSCDAHFSLNRNVGAVGRKSYDFTVRLNARSVLLRKHTESGSVRWGNVSTVYLTTFSIFFSFSGCARTGITGSPCTENVTYVRHACLMPKNTCKQMDCSWIDSELGNLANEPRNQTRWNKHENNKNQTTTLPPNWRSQRWYALKNLAQKTCPALVFKGFKIQIPINFTMRKQVKMSQNHWT